MSIHQAQKNEFPIKRDPSLPPPPQNPYETVAIQRVVDLELKFEERLREINGTLLALATHIESLSTPTQSKVSREVRRVWTPEKSDMLLWKTDKVGVSWDNHYKGSKIFLVCGGPSLSDTDLSLMDNRGVMSMCMNNSWCMVKPDIWIGFDSPGRFHNGGWEDPSIMKIVPWQRREEKLTHRVNGELQPSDLTPLDMPNCWMLSNNTTFNPDTWFTEKSANWGGPIEGVEPEGGFRVTMFGALRTLYYLGFQEVYLLGCDWEMPTDMSKEAYAWEENRAQSVREKNNDMYRWLEGGLKKLLPGFERANFQIYNCNRNSKLSLFPFIQYEDAIERCSIPTPTNTRGWYDIPNNRDTEK